MPGRAVNSQYFNLYRFSRLELEKNGIGLNIHQLGKFETKRLRKSVHKFTSLLFIPSNHLVHEE